MHDIVFREFEDHLNGNASAAFHDHLRTCESCRGEVEGITGITSLLHELAPAADGNDAPQPSPAFYAALANRIVETEASRSWGLFSIGDLFFRRVAFASLILLACLGSFLVTREASEGGADAASIMAQHDAISSHSDSADRERLLVTLAEYR